MSQNQTNLEEQLKQQQQAQAPNQGTGTLAPPIIETKDTIVPPSTTPPGDIPGQEQQDPTNDLEMLKQQLKEYQDKEKVLTQQGLTQDQKEIKDLQDQIKEMAMKPLIDSKYYKESELLKYSHDQLKAMNDILGKVTGLGQPAGSGPPNRTSSGKADKEKKTIGRQWDDRQEKWVP